MASKGRDFFIGHTISFPDRRHPGAETDAGRLNNLYEKTRAALPARSSKAAEAGKAGASREPPPSGLENQRCRRKNRHARAA